MAAAAAAAAAAGLPPACWAGEGDEDGGLPAGARVQRPLSSGFELVFAGAGPCVCVCVCVC